MNFWCESSRWTGDKPEVCKFLKTVEIDKNITQTFHVNTSLQSLYQVSW